MGRRLAALVVARALPIVAAAPALAAEPSGGPLADAHSRRPGVQVMGTRSACSG